jgi:capreomycidine synthase
MRFSQALLEDWMRDYYFSTDIDLGSSGVECWSMADLRALLGISHAELDSIVFRDSTTYGGVELRQAISQRWGDGNPDGVMVTHGSSEAIFLTMCTLLEPGDEIVVLDPCYHSLSAVAESTGCVIKHWQLLPEHEFAPDVAALQSLVGPRTRMVVVNFPHNPTGVTLTPSQQQQVVDTAARAGAYLVWDAVLADLTYDGEPLPDPTLSYGRSISIRSFSKAFGLPGLRFGWCMAAPEVLTSFLPLRDRLTLHLSPLVEFIALRVVQHADKLLDIRLKQARSNLDLLTDWVGTMSDQIDWVRPRPLGGVTIFPRLLRYADIEAVCHALGKEYGTLLVPGNCFDVPDRVRLGFGGPTADLELGLSRLAELLGKRET